ncbi:3-oxoacyl-[acyl-carrier-protein] synthase III C-terminal domain-containing protein [Heyndrickxia sp. NPDC080065]|uniref:3-oxoacyl-[acyl-carrier-protein] synthase III C-terminal domain-containing protein n=1 Tax=Heyndrickxia sp. NPDC080065 TaxID=3390568 RepID=UPI003D057029
MTSIKIKEVEIYHPENVVNNDHYIQHFKEKGKDITEFLEVMGKKERYIIDNDTENGLTMGIESAKRVLKKANMSGKDIDYIVFSTQVPEMTFPTNALYVHDAIGAKENTISIDSNGNCAGMTIAVEQACRYMLSNDDISTALVVGSDYLSLVANPEEEITYALYGDAACAVILEKTEEDTGFIDAKYHVFTKNIDKIIFPENGLTKTLRGSSDSKFVHFELFDASFGTPITCDLIHDLLSKHQLEISDISAFCLSQFTLNDKIKIQEHFGIEENKVIYIGDRFAYTGTSSPFIAFYQGIKDGRIKRGDHVLFWTVGAGHQFIAMLFKY